MSTTMVLCASHAPGMDRDTEGALGRTFRQGVAQARDRVAAFDPELVLLFGGDHRRAFRGIVPTMGVAYTASLMAEGVQAAATLDVPTDIARGLSEFLLRSHFDVTVCREIELDHAFGQPLVHYLGAVNRVPVIPMPINCASAPLPTAARVVAYGQKVGEFLQTLDKRVLLIGTGGLAHNPPSLDNDCHDLTEDERRALIQNGVEEARRRMNPGWDKRFLAAMESWDLGVLIDMTDNCVPDAGVGANEVRTWLAAAAAGGGGIVQTLGYEPVTEWITGMGVMASAAA